jgi:hypothetical protein
LIGGIAVYVAMASCGSEAPTTSPGVAPAQAQTAIAAAAITEQCSNVGNMGGSVTLYAEHAFPGKTAAELAGLRVLGHVAPTGKSGMLVQQPGYDYMSAQYDLVVKDGSAAVYCGNQAPDPFFDFVIFLP